MATETTAVALKNDPRVPAFKQIFEGQSFQKALADTLPRHVSPSRMIRVVLAAMQNTPKLMECTPNSVALSVLRAAAMGLEPDGGPLGQAYLIPYGKECQFIPGYRGLIKLARNSGEIADVWAEVVYEGDRFEYSLGLNPDLSHVRNDSGDVDPAKLKYAYAVARFRDGERKFVVMNKAEIEKIREKSPGGKSGPWKEWTAEMWKKTAVRRLSKYLPLSVEMHNAIEEDGQVSVSFDGVFEQPQQAEQEALPEPKEAAKEPDHAWRKLPIPDDWKRRLRSAETADEVEGLRKDFLEECDGDDRDMANQACDGRKGELEAT